MALVGAGAELKGGEGVGRPLGGWAWAGPGCPSGAWVKCPPPLQCGAPVAHSSRQQHTPPPTPASRSATGKPFRAAGHFVPVEAAACPGPAEGRKSWEQSPGQPGQHLVRRPKGGRGHFRKMLFIFLFLNKSEVSRGTNEVIRKDMSGIKPQASRLRRALGTRTLKRWDGACLSCALRAQDWDRGAGQACPRALHSLFPRCRWEFGCERCF